MVLKFTNKLFFTSFVMLLTTAASAQENPYTYVKMSLFVPWAMYFFFLVAVLIPFVVMIVLAWRRQQQVGPNENDEEII